MKIKLKDKNVKVPPFDSYCGLATEEWNNLNHNRKIELKYIPLALKDYVEIIEEKPKEKQEEKPKKEKE